MGSTPAPGTVFRRPRGNRRARHERKNNVTKRSIFKSLGLALRCAGLVFATAAVHPHRTVPIGGTFGTTFKLIPTATPGVFDDPIEGGGGVQRPASARESSSKPWISEPNRPADFESQRVGLDLRRRRPVDRELSRDRHAGPDERGFRQALRHRNHHRRHWLLSECDWRITRARSCPCGHGSRRFPG